MGVEKGTWVRIRFIWLSIGFAGGRSVLGNELSVPLVGSRTQRVSAGCYKRKQG
jgi:hypothetical protein